MFIIKYRKWFFALSTLTVVLSFVAIFYFGLNFGIDFKGGTFTEVTYTGARPPLAETRAAIEKMSLGGFSLQPSGTDGYIVRTRELSQDEKNVLSATLSFENQNPLVEKQSNSVGPVAGKELRNKAYLAIAVVILGIVLFVTFAFRKVSQPVQSWKYGLATIIALAHDVVVPTGVFVIFAKFHGGEIDLLFVTALLAILGYSVHDTIVVFDRVRENLRLPHKESFEDTVGKSVSQTFGRSINTSLTIFLVLVVLYFLGGESTRDFAFILLIGVIAGTYSSIFLASPLLVTLEKLGIKKYTGKN